MVVRRARWIRDSTGCRGDSPEPPPPAAGVPRPPFRPPEVHVGRPAEYAYWKERARRFLAESGRDPSTLRRTDATIHYASNRVILFRLADPRHEGSVGETLSHETLHALLDQLGEPLAARRLDRIAAPVGSRRRAGGL